MEAAATESVLVEVDPARAGLPELLGAVDAALAAPLAALRVHVPLAAEDPRRAPLEQLCAADARVSVGVEAPPADIGVAMPAHARPQPRTLPEVVAVLRNGGLAAVEVPVPGRFARLPGRGRLRATAAGSGSRTLRPGEVGLRSTATRGRPAPPPQGDLAHERAEHLRHRARSATMRARMDRNAQRLYRERLQTRHERTRLRLAEERLARTSAGEWARWRARGVARQAARVPGAVGSGVASVRSFGRRSRRYARERWRDRRGNSSS